MDVYPGSLIKTRIFYGLVTLQNIGKPRGREFLAFLVSLVALLMILPG